MARFVPSQDCMVYPGFLRRLFWWALAVALLRPGLAAAALEQTFPVLQIGTQTYSNVTVTTKSATYIFILHSAGMTNIKVKDLTPELRVQLGYDEAGKPATTGGNTATWAKQTFSKMDAPQLREMGKQLRETWRTRLLAPLQKPGLIRSWAAQVALGIMLVLYFFYCHCCKLICQKAGTEPGALVWVPFLHPFPLLRAAGMSYWWVLAFAVPILNLAAFIIWCMRIAKARGKNAAVGIWLMVPLINILAFIYLAFSNGGPAEPEKPAKPAPLIALETA
jgi:hypothetical protein